MPESRPCVSLMTMLGNIEVEVCSDRAPLTAANFLRHVDAGLYDRAAFYRSLRTDNGPPGGRVNIVQGGIDPSCRAPPLAPIAHEPTGLTSLRHGEGAVSMARWELGTAASEFFIVLADAPDLDEGGLFGAGYAVFGQVIGGLDVARQIGRRPTGGASEVPYLEGQELLAAEPFRAVRVSITNPGAPGDAEGD